MINPLESIRKPALISKPMADFIDQFLPKANKNIWVMEVYKCPNCKRPLADPEEVEYAENVGCCLTCEGERI